MAIVGFIASVCTAFNLPMFGFILARYVSVLALPVTTDEEIDIYQHERNKWTWAFAGLVIAIGLSTFV